MADEKNNVNGNSAGKDNIPKSPKQGKWSWRQVFENSNLGPDEKKEPQPQAGPPQAGEKQASGAIPPEKPKETPPIQLPEEKKGPEPVTPAKEQQPVQPEPEKKEPEQAPPTPEKKEPQPQAGSPQAGEKQSEQVQPQAVPPVQGKKKFMQKKKPIPQKFVPPVKKPETKDKQVPPPPPGGGKQKVQPKKKGSKGKFFLIFLVIIIGGCFVVFKYVLPPTKIFEQQQELTKQEMPETLQEGEGAVQVKAFRVAYVRFEDSLAILGTVKGYKQIDLRFQGNGIIEKFNFREGDYVKKNELIARLVPKEAKLRLAYNENKLKVQEKKREISGRKLAKKKAFFEAGAIIQAEVVEAQLEYEAANAQVELTQRELDLAKNEVQKTQMYAPMDAFMGTREADPGEFVNANTKIGSIFDITNVFIELGVIEKDVRKIQLGQKVSIFVEAYPGADFSGTVEKIPAIVEGKSRTMPLKIKINNTDNLLKPGMFVRSKVFVFEKDEALIVPALSLIDSDGDGSFDSVFVIEYGEKVTLREIKVGYVTTDYAEVVEGLEEGEEIVVETAGQLDDGTKVEITDIEEYGL